MTHTPITPEAARPLLRTCEPLRAAIKRALRALVDFIRRFSRRYADLVHPPSAERLWIREHARAERAEAALWLDRHLANFERTALA